MVERSAVNRMVVGSSPTIPAIFDFTKLNISKIIMKLSSNIQFELSDPISIDINNDDNTVSNITINSITFKQVFDNPVLKQVVVEFYEFIYPILIWDGDEYDSVGDWNFEKLFNKISNIISTNPSEFVNKGFNIKLQQSPERSSILSKRILSKFPYGSPLCLLNPEIKLKTTVKDNPTPRVQPQLVPAP